MGIGIDHDAAGLDLPGHICDLLCALGYHRIGIVLVELLHGDEGAERLFQTAFLGRFIDIFRHLRGPLGLEFNKI